MFNRKQIEETGNGKTGDARSRPLPLETARPASAQRTEVPRRMPENGATSSTSTTEPTTPRTAPGDSKKLIVGPDISLHGHIASCDRLVVEGTVEAELTDCHTIEIAETGVFTGAAEIEGADISGRYEGSLTVRGHLLIRSTGSVSGTIRYGRLEIQPGGIANGDMKNLQSSSRTEKTVPTRLDFAAELDAATPRVQEAATGTGG
jgi:cytoskeletal protein CcmA (bactofilin family)